MKPIQLTDDHTGMRVNYNGLLMQSRAALARGLKEQVLAEMLRQFQNNLTELGQRWYTGDTAAVDEFLQLFCIAEDARKTLKSATTAPLPMNAADSAA